MSEKVQNQATAAQGFWDVFKACLEENWIRPDRSPFYVKWAQALVEFLPGKKLRDRSREDIELFPADQLLKMTGHQYGPRSNFCQRSFEGRQNATVLHNLCVSLGPIYTNFQADANQKNENLQRKNTYASLEPAAFTLMTQFRVILHKERKLLYSKKSSNYHPNQLDDFSIPWFL